MNLQALLEKTTAPDFLRGMIGFKIQRLMALKVETLTGAEAGARTSDRLNQRIGYSHHDRCNRTGRVELRVPKAQIADCGIPGKAARNREGDGCYSRALRFSVPYEAR